MKHLRSAALVALLFAAATGFGQTNTTISTTTGFDCWIGDSGSSMQTRFIRCMVDRDLASFEVSDTQTEAAMQLLHREFHARSGAAAENMFKANIDVIRSSPSVWSIRIFSYPSDWSWQEGTPERLVRAVLCPSVGTCSVTIRKD